MDETKLAKYTIFLNSVENILQKYFEEQKEYIKCAPKCSHCCESGSFPASEVEFAFVRQGIKTLDEKTQKELKLKCLELYEKRHIYLQQGKDIFEFTYKCPFLLNKTCLVYDYRPLVCRIHGLMSYSYTEEGVNSQKIELPCCTELGLNYAEVYNKTLKTVSQEKAKQLNKKVPPRVYPIGYSKLLEEFGNIGYGDIRMLFEWVLLDIPNYQELINKIKQNI